MRSILLCVLVASACASAPVGHAVNIPATRHEIDDTIAADPGVTRVTGDFEYESATPGSRPVARAAATGALTPSRRIASVGRVTADHAVVYTRAGDGRGGRLEETWVRGRDGWTLHHVKELAASNGASAAR